MFFLLLHLHNIYTFFQRFINIILRFHENGYHHKLILTAGGLVSEMSQDNF